jgi:hypothetical protein
MVPPGQAKILYLLKYEHFLLFLMTHRAALFLIDSSSPLYYTAGGVGQIDTIVA